MELKAQQASLNIDEQIENLKSLGLILGDEEYAKKLLNDIAYFRLIKAYSLTLKKKNSNYTEGTTFDEIVNLYLFNANMRQLLFGKIEQIEVNLRCRISNRFSSQYGVLGYEDEANFGRPEYHDSFLSEMKIEVDRNSKSPFVKNFRHNYEDGKIPFYALIELFSFGTLSKFYKILKAIDKKDIASNYKIGYTFLESWIENISYVRNICAHYGRLYNAKFPKTPTLYKQYTDKGIGNNRLFATLICMKYLLSIDDKWMAFVSDIEELFNKYPNVDIKTMGFPENWKEYLTKYIKE